MGTHDWGIISQTIGTVLAPLKGGGGAPVPLTPPEPPPPPPVPPASGGGDAAAGAAAQAVKDATAALGKITTELSDLDASANAKLEAIVAAGQAGKAELDRVEKDVEAKCAELGPRLETPQGQRELQDYVEQRLGQARTVINESMKAADDNAQQTRELTDRYAGVGTDGKDNTTTTTTTTTGGGEPGGGGTAGPGTAAPGGGGTGGGAAAPGAGGTGGAGGGADTPPETKAAEPAVQPAAAATPFGTPMMPMGAGGMPMGGMGGGIPLSLPSLGGGGLGGVPSFGGGDPLSALSGLGSGGEHPMGFKDDAALQPPPSDGTALTSTHSDDTTGGGKGGDGSGGQQTTPAGTTGAVDAPGTGGKGDGAGSGGGAGAGDGAVVAAGAPAPPPAKTTEVALPNGATTEARTPAGAAAVRAILGGASVSEGYAQQGVTLPPPGTPVTDPVPPTQLKAGDVGVWKDHMVMALGNKQVLVNGQVQPQESVGSGPDFLGWIDPTKLANPPAQA